MKQISIFILVCSFLLSGVVVNAGSVTNVSVQIESPYTGLNTAGEIATYRFSFDVQTAIPGGGHLEIHFPERFGIHSSQEVSCQLNGVNNIMEGSTIPDPSGGLVANVGVPGGESVLASPTGYTYTFNTCSVEVIHPLTSGSYSNLSIMTYDQNNNLLDGNLLIPGTTVVPADTTSPISVTIASPVVGETITAGAQDYPIMIERTGSREVEYVLIYQSLDGGTTWIPLDYMSVPSADFSASGYEASQQMYAWDVPNVVSQSIRLKVVAYGVQHGISVAEYEMTGNVNIVPAAAQGSGNILPGIPVRSLIKASGPAVYYYAEDGRRYVFPSESVFFSWYEDFDSVITITDTELASVPLGNKRITMRSGTWLIKIQSDPTVYAVEQGTKRPIVNEAQAVLLYGTNWNQRIVDIAPTFFTDYKLSRDMATVYPWGTILDYNGQHYMADGDGDGGGYGSWFLLTTLVEANLRVQNQFILPVSSDPGYILGATPSNTDYLNSYRYWSPSLAY